MSQYGCYIFDRLFCECGECPACVHRILQEGQEKASEKKEAVGRAIGKFYKRVASGKYVSPEEKREKARQKALEL